MTGLMRILLLALLALLLPPDPAAAQGRPPALAPQIASPALVDGVLVDQRQARNAYEARVRQQIDPGLAEVERSNLFRTRVFPILPDSGRTIRLRFVSPLDRRDGYVLAFRDTDEIGTFTVDIEATGLARTPDVRIPAGGEGDWQRIEGGQRFAFEARRVTLDGDLQIAWGTPAAPLLVSRHSNGERFFEIVDEAPAPGASAASRPRSVTILWDRSLSRRDDNLDEEIAILRQYLEQVRPQRIELRLFDAGAVESWQATSVDSLVNRLRGVTYRGATSLDVVAREPVRADSCLLFSDGLVTIDRRAAFRPDCPLFVLSSAADADRPYLASLARDSGGEAFDLTVREAGEVLIRITRTVPRVADVQSASGQRLDYRLLDAGEHGWRIVGRMPASGDVLVRLRGLASGDTERLYSGSAAVVDADGPAALWAAERAALMAASDERDRDALLAFSRSFSVASPDVSFLVLETGRDYAISRIEPPSNLPSDLLDEYRRVRDEVKQSETHRRSQRLETVLAQWQEMRRWWETRFDPILRARAPDGRPRPEEGQARSQGVLPPPPPPPPPPLPPPPPVAQSESSAAVDSGDQIVVTGGSGESVGAPASAGGAARQAGRGAIAIEPWSPDRPYLAALDGADAADRDRVFAEQQTEHGALPAFWLDVADWAFRKGRRAEAIQLVLSALELPTRNSETLSIVAERLIRYGEIDRAIWLYERLAAAVDDRPQPRRSLALALAKRAESAPPEQARADLARAISLLTEVVMTPWNPAYDGIEMISLVEANRLIARYRAAGGRDVALDPRLIALLDVDLRVTIEWYSDATDVDLWVDEATGERAIYHNPRTAAGGRLSNDMTQGFGPEEYLLRRAITGAYEVRANVFAADRLNPNGAQRVTAKIIRDFGRPTEREEIVDIELLPTDQTRERRIGQVVFGR